MTVTFWKVFASDSSFQPALNTKPRCQEDISAHAFHTRLVDSCSSKVCILASAALNPKP